MIKRKLALLSLATLTFASACTTAKLPSAEQIGSASLYHSDGRSAGTASVTAIGDVVSLSLAVTGLGEGSRGFHLHTTGQCDAPDFSSAGGHLNPTREGHGLEDDDGSHLGDLPNLVSGQSTVTTSTVVLRGSRAYLTGQLFDADGTAIVIHADPDDGTSEPSGNAGKRIACGVIERV